MGKLIELPIKSLFNGVSRQPHNVRLTSQVEEADNTLLSVVTGGFEKRPCSQRVLTMTGLASSGEYAVHTIDRDPTEQYVVVIDNAGVLKVYDVVNDVEKTVNSYASSLQTYINTTNPRTDLAFVTIADYTIIVNRTKTTALGSAAASGSVTYVDTFGDLTAGGASGVHGVTNLESTFDDYFVTYNSTTGAWEETVKPGLQNSFDATTMPHQLVRQSNGTWTLSQVTWGERTVGDTTTVPAPNFIGKTIKDAFFFRNRLGVLADENVFFSQSGDFFNLWPDKATSVLDTDPIDVAASTTKVTLLRWAIPFRKSLFLSADRAQFELSTAGTLTPSSATIDLATNYSTSNLAKPVALGDELYFAGKSGDNSVVYEYFVEDDTLTNVAIDVTKHAEGYVPADITMMTGDPTTGRLFCYTDQADGTDNDQLYVYTVYFDGEQKAQSAWTRWDFNCTAIKGMGVIEGNLYLVTDRNGTIVLERVPLMAEEANATLGHAVMLDARTNVTGTFASGTGLTTWTLPYPHRSVAQGIVSSGTDAGKKLSLTYTGSGATAATMTAVGDFSGSAVIFGLPYTMLVELSRQYVRERDNSSIIRGRFQMRSMRVYFTDTGYFEATVTPIARDAKTYTMSGRILGTSTNIVGKPALLTDTFQFPIKSRGDQVKIELKNGSHMPSTINAAVSVGYFNEITRAE